MLLSRGARRDRTTSNAQEKFKLAVESCKNLHVQEEGNASARWMQGGLRQNFAKDSETIHDYRESSREKIRPSSKKITWTLN